MNNLCSDIDLMDFLSSDHNTCKLEVVPELPSLPTKDNPFAFFDVNIDDESYYAIHLLEWTSDVSINFKDLSQTSTMLMIKKLNDAAPNNYLYSEKVVGTINQIISDVSTQLTMQCNEQFSGVQSVRWTTLLETPHTGDVHPFFVNGLDFKYSYPHWHMDGQTTESNYRVTIALKGANTPFYSGLNLVASDFQNKELKYVYSLNLGMKGEGIEQANFGQGALFNRHYALHALPYHKSNRIVMLGTFYCR